MSSLEKIRLVHQKNLNLFREWFHVVQDLNPAYLQASDYELAREIYIGLGISWPDRNEDELQRLMKSDSPRRILRHGIDLETAKAFDKRLELAEAALVAAGYERMDVDGHWRKSNVVNAEFDPDFQEVKDGASYRWMGSTAREWQERYASMEKLAEYHANEAEKYQRMLGATERNFKSVQTGYTAAVQRYQAAESKIDELHELAPRSCRALVEFLGKTRDEVSHEVITAIVLLERSKP